MRPKRKVILTENRLAEAAINSTISDLYDELTTLSNLISSLTSRLSQVTTELTTLITAVDQKTFKLSELWSATNLRKVLSCDIDANLNLLLGGSHGASLNLKYATNEMVLSLVGAATTWTAAIPDGSLVLGVSTIITRTITGALVTGYTIGDGVDADRWGAITGLAIGVKSGNANWVIGTIDMAIVATDLVITAVGATPTAGSIRVGLFYADLISLIN